MLIMSQLLRFVFLASLYFSLIGCSSTRILWDKPGLTIDDFNRDRYACVQESRVSWSGGGTGGLGLIMIVSSKSNAEKQSLELFKMCMEARGYFGREANEDLENHLSQLVREYKDQCRRDEFKILTIKTACSANDLTLDQLSDNSKMSDLEKSLFLKYRTESQVFTNKLLETIRTYGGPKDKEYSVALERFNPQKDKNANDLYEGKITWGEYNKDRKEITQAINDERKRIFTAK